MASRSRVFVGDPRSAVIMQPFVEPAPFSKTGIPLGPSLVTQRLVKLDPPQMKEDGTWSGSVIKVLGEWNAGKSTLFKILAHRFSCIQADNPHYDPENPDDESEPQYFRVRMMSKKTEKGEDEVKPVTEYLGGNFIDASQPRCINIFDFYNPDPKKGLTEIDLLEIAINSAETAKGAALEGFEPLVFQVGVNLMLHKFDGAPMLETLDAALRTMQFEDIGSYYADRSEATIKSLEASMTPLLAQQLKFSPTAPHHVPQDEFLRNIALCSVHLGKILSGDFGPSFGGNASWRNNLSALTTAIDIGGMNKKALGLFMAMMWKWEASAIRRGDIGLIPHLNITDEASGPAKTLQGARWRQEHVKEIRKVFTTDMVGTQFDEDLTEVGEAGSELRALSESIGRSTGAWIVGNTPLDDKRKEWLAQRGVSPLDAEVIPTLQTGCFMFKARRRPTDFFQLMPLPSEWAFIETNSANDSMLNRQSVSNFQRVRDRMEALQQIGYLS